MTRDGPARHGHRGREGFPTGSRGRRRKSGVLADRVSWDHRKRAGGLSRRGRRVPRLPRGSHFRPPGIRRHSSSTAGRGRPKRW